MGRMNLMDVRPTSISWLWTRISPGWKNLPTQILLLLLFALLLDYVKRLKRNPRYPPGPAPLPFIGNLLLIDANKPYQSLQRIGKRFGIVFSLQFGWYNFVILNGFKVIKMALVQNTEEFADRPPLLLFKIVDRTRNSPGILLAPCSSRWKQQKKFVAATLKNLCKKNLEKIVSEEVEYVCSEFKSKKGSPFIPERIIYYAASNIIFTIILGYHFEYNDESFLKLLHLLEEYMKIATRLKLQLLITTPLMSYIPGPHHKFRKIYFEITTILKDIVQEHKSTRNLSFSRNLVDRYLEELEKPNENPESSFNEQNLIHIILDLFVAGNETIHSTILWGLLMMGRHPNVQNKVHEEIDEVIGMDKLPTMKDQPKLPYTKAVIHEIQRFCPVVPATFPTKTSRDVEIDTFVIPKGTFVINSLSSALMDETMWEKPRQFYPQHFLDADGQFVKREAFLPFSAGRHVCPGEPLAKVELFIIFTTILQHFTFCIPENSLRSMEDFPEGLVVTPPPFEICANPR